MKTKAEQTQNKAGTSPAAKLEMHTAPSIGLFGWFDAWIVDLVTGQTVADASALSREQAEELAWADLAFEIAYAEGRQAYA